ncbi:hypothetical protein A2834_00345 [Candidatus Giovannonibacteria bacterium RIFCSPHIGHO2_01_FULL_45_23]|uniref:Uncharacterized protein n=1 Tax=Candidatus Giovannonibacteria bacterium RIFCSPHIGHO2_01_FULL_45_23 TaxID=1798325 RepID=A0A1F5VEN8_9BACT|nr:MAG: hypothetical protein A2834_00345 [Candidatus Giovannonibacteria bacterium RIFCSPHIGHO2_01_FULL_45_23]
MNSAQRRKIKRRWFRENAEEISRVIGWINSPNQFVMSNFWRDDCIEMEPERLAVFGSSYSYTKAYWRGYLIKKGIDPERFRQLHTDLKLISP